MRFPRRLWGALRLIAFSRRIVSPLRPRSQVGNVREAPNLESGIALPVACRSIAMEDAHRSRRHPPHFGQHHLRHPLERTRPRAMRRRMNERVPLGRTQRPKPAMASSKSSYRMSRGLAARMRRAKEGSGWSFTVGVSLSRSARPDVDTGSGCGGDWPGKPRGGSRQGEP